MNAQSSIKADKARYPTDAKVRKYVALARSCGIDVALIEVSPDGTIRVGEARAVSTPGTDFDRLEDQL